LPVLKKLDEFVTAGAHIVGQKPKAATGLKGFPASDAEVKKIADKLWDSGRISTKPAGDALTAQGVEPDFSWKLELPFGLSGRAEQLDYIHRRSAEADIFFVANRSTNAVSANCTFRISGRLPELWNPVTGDFLAAPNFKIKDGSTVVALDFNPCGSWFVVFRKPWAADGDSNPKVNLELMNFDGAWTVSFDPKWGGPDTVEFDSLVSWTARAESGIKFYSGAATYSKAFDLPKWGIRNPQPRILLDLGEVRELAEVKVNGQSCGITWTPPFRVDITKAVKPGTNSLEVEVVNFWPNRIIGDAGLPKDQRLTRTNIRKLTKDTALMPSGLLGPVRLIEQR